MKKYVEQYLLHLKKTKSLSTYKNYRAYMHRFLSWGAKPEKPEEFTTKHIDRYKNWLATLLDSHGDPLNPKTINYHFIALRSFFGYLAQKKVKVLDKNAFILDKVEDKPLPRLTKKDIDKLLNAPHHARALNTYEHFIRLRDIALMEVLISTGMMVSELSRLKKKDIVFDDRIIIVEGGARNRRRLRTNRQALHALKVYFDNRKDSNVHAFVSHDKRSGKHKGMSDGKKGLSTRSIQRIIQTYATRVGLAGRVTPHALRHAYADRLLKEGANVAEVQLKMGHSTKAPAENYKKEMARKKRTRSQRFKRQLDKGK